MSRPFRLVYFTLLAVLVLTSAARAAVTVSADKTGVTLGSGKTFSLKLNLTTPTDVAVKAFDAQGKFLRALLQKHVEDKQLPVAWDLKDATGATVAPGEYLLRIEAGVRLKPDKSFASDGVLTSEAFKSPAVLRLDKEGNLYLLDAAAGTLFKFNPDGQPINEWKEKNTIVTPLLPPPWRGLAVEPDGSRIYLSQSMSTSHYIDVYDGRTGQRLHEIGGYFGDDADWLKEKGGIAYPVWLGLNGESKLYTTSPGYEMIAAYDRQKKGKPAGVWLLGRKYAPRLKWNSAGDAGDTDGGKAIYLASYEAHNRAQLFKIKDQGDSGVFAYDITKYKDPRSKKEVELLDIYGIAYDGQQGLWVAERGPARILKMVDTGTDFEVVSVQGSRGKTPSRLEFLALRGVAVSPDGKYLYVIEDGEAISKRDASPGPARVEHYKIDYVDRKQVKLTVKP